VRDFTSLEAGLSLMPGLPPDEVVRLLGERADRLRMDLRALDANLEVAVEKGLPDLFLVESRYRRCLLTAELDFVGALAHDIRSGTFAGTHTWRRIHELRADGMPFEEILRDPVTHLGEEARALAPQPPA
jgi:hypothetical protein